MRNALLGAIALTAAIAAGSARAQRGWTFPIAVLPANNAGIRQAVETCIAITGSDWIELDMLRDRFGWKNLITAADNGGKQPDAGIFRKPGNEALIVILGWDLREKRCRVVTRLAKTEDYLPVRAAATEWLGSPRFKDRRDRYTWKRGPNTIQLIRSGEPGEPNAEFAVTSSQRSKDKQ